MKNFKDFRKYLRESESGPTRMEIQKRFDTLKGIYGVGKAKQDVSKEFKLKNLNVDSKGQVINFQSASWSPDPLFDDAHDSVILWDNAEEAEPNIVYELLKLIRRYSTEIKPNSFGEPIIKTDLFTVVFSPLEKEVRVEFIDMKDRKSIDRFKITKQPFLNKIKSELDKYYQPPVEEDSEILHTRLNSSDFKSLLDYIEKNKNDIKISPFGEPYILDPKKQLTFSIFDNRVEVEVYRPDIEKVVSVYTLEDQKMRENLTQALERIIIGQFKTKPDDVKRFHNLLKKRKVDRTYFTSFAKTGEKRIVTVPKD